MKLTNATAKLAQLLPDLAGFIPKPDPVTYPVVQVGLGADQMMSHVQQLIDRHAELLERNPYCYFELAYTRTTEWMAWICSNAKELDPARKVLASGQGSSPDEACNNALEKLNVTVD